MGSIGQYQILETIHGGRQPLYRAQGADGREVALKATPVAAITPEARAHFAREAETCRALDHPNLARVLDAGESDGVLYQAMEILEGASLGKIMAEGRPLGWDMKLAIMEQVAEGLEYAHSRHLVHGDIKPANIFVEDSGRVRVLDFGMVRVPELGPAQNGSQAAQNYLAPEQIRRERCTAATDVFSAGVVFYQLAAGSHPFSAPGRSLPQVVSAIVFGAPARLGDLCPDAPEGLEFVLHRALEKDAARRLQSGGELKQALGLYRKSMAAAAPLARAATATAGQVSEPAAAPRVPMAPLPAPPVSPLPPPPKPPPQSMADPVSVSGLMFRYCTACAAPNRMDAKICRSCHLPLGENVPAAAASPQSRGALYVAIAVAAILAIALLTVLLSR